MRWRLECAVLERMAFEGSRNFCTTVVGELRKKKELFSHISLHPLEKLRTRKSEASPCSARMLGTDVWLEPCALNSEWKVCGLMLHSQSYDGGFTAAVPFEGLSLRTGGGIQTLLLEGCALHRDQRTLVPW